ncbi:PepSY domain-containing protein [Flavobacterium silvaticum]|uniref:NADPH--hemoprotein reductase n=1 Tax=Flavobacterium silvaticum TaxID=1852020 RepID=A0A972JFQ6_9FLAO|nr:PepSY domain-containing protein [Flavobacterium silvaticum]NMH28229.1 FAD-binding oxidoreductase [Flavobacterium silvaticum]
MTISIWRYSHLALAVSSFLFITLASVTGIILAFEPVSESLKPYAVSNLGSVTLSQTITSVQKEYDEILEIKVGDRFVSADVITKDGDSKHVYINPKTGKSLGEVQKKDAFFEWVTTLHRSLFLHGFGRFFMGLTAFLLLLIALTGSILVIKRQRGIRHFFSKVIREDFFSFYHVLFGRFWLVPILIIALTGSFLTLEEFNLFPKQKISHNVDFEKIREVPKLAIKDFPIFNNTELSHVKAVEFPFSPDPEDAFTIKLDDREIVVNQFTGDILSDQKTRAVSYWKNLSLDLHTGRANTIWALVLAIAALNILFFIYSGFAMTLKRIGGKIKNKFKKDESEFIILAGSENGSTMQFAKSVHLALIKAGKKSFLGELNNYDAFPKAQHLLFFTATYGNGEAPANATKALNQISKITQSNQPKFSVVAFGSHAYPDFCKFGFDLFNRLSNREDLEPFLEIKIINDKSIQAFGEWVADFCAKTGIALDVDFKQLSSAPKKRTEFTVVSKTEASVEESFLIRLKAKNVKFQSGDLFNIYPANDHRLRQYSIGKISNEIQLSVKYHKNGLGSEFLYNLNIGDTILASVDKNPNFHFPKKATSVVLISNGTGIAPFLGMISENPNIPTSLYAGFRDGKSFSPYRNDLETYRENGKLEFLNLAYSREKQRQYVWELVSRDMEKLTLQLHNGAVFLICGSLSMQNDVLKIFSLMADELGEPLSHFQANGQIKMDCY